MKDKLRQVYQRVFDGTLPRHEALDAIAALKRRVASEGEGTLLAAPQWQGRELATTAAPATYAEHHVLLCELPGVNGPRLGGLVPGSRVRILQAGCSATVGERYAAHAVACFESIQAVLRGKPKDKVLIHLVVPSDMEHAPIAGLSGLFQTTALEHPSIVGRLVLVPDDIQTTELAAYLRADEAYGCETLVNYADSGRQVRCWQELEADPHERPMTFADRGVYLITGGLGALGRLFATEILERTREARVVVSGRSPLSDERRAFVDRLSTPSGRMSYRQVDLCDLRDVAETIADLEQQPGSLSGILHCAGTIADNFILNKSEEEFRRVLAPKVAGTCNLDHASRHVDLDFFVLFSSLAGAMGNVGQADYSAASAFLDWFAVYRNMLVAGNQRRGRTRSIAWPLWQAGGMPLTPAKQALLRRATGVRTMPTATGMRAFARSLALPHAHTLVMDGDLAQMRRTLRDGPVDPSVAAIPAPPAPAVTTADIDDDQLFAKTQAFLRQQLSSVLKLPPDRINPEAPMEQYGIDSILAMTMTSQLEDTFGPLSKTLFFEYRSVHELARYFITSHSARVSALAAARYGHQRPALPPVSAPALAAPRSRTTSASPRRIARSSATTAATPASDPIAVIGLSGRYPGATDLEAYWRNLRDGVDSIGEVPLERWDWRHYYSDDHAQPGSHYSKWGGFIAGVDEFDPLFFNISPRDAKHIDPQERLFLQHAWAALEDAGYTRESLQVPDERDLPGQVGVYAGVMYTEYQLFGADASARGHRLALAGSAASVANRVSYALNLHGPSMTVDSMCSSSLTAIHLACQDLRLGRTILAIAGGVNVSIHPNKYLLLSTGQFISSEGRCQSFGEGGNGYIPGEGVGVAVLKRLSEAVRDKDHVYGVIRGSALNHGGRTNGYTVPNPHAQAGTIDRALTDAQIDPRYVTYIEAHGTGTKLGDPIEVAGLTAAFHRATRDTGFCFIGSVKSNIGHGESAAGIAGLTKVLLQLQHRQIVPSLHSAQLNPHIDFGNSPFVVNQTLRPWTPPEIDGRTRPRIAGLSSFGAGGSNAHLIVEEYQPAEHQPIAVAAVAILLSARTAVQLQQKAQDLLMWIRTRSTPIDLAATAYTLQVGREAMEERLGLVVDSTAELMEKLGAYVAGERPIDDLYQGQVKRHADALSVFKSDEDLRLAIDNWLANRKLTRLADLWTKGLDVDWRKLYDDETRPSRLSMPTYPFARERYWIDPIEPPAEHAIAASTAAAGSVLHPLVHYNVSTLSEQRYRSMFTGAEGMFADDRKVLPVGAYLEMARAAVADATSVPQGEVLSCELRNIAWADAIVITRPTEVLIALMPDLDDPRRTEFEIYSRHGEHEMVHCQGSAIVGPTAMPPRMDDRIRRPGEIVATVDVPEAADLSTGCLLHPNAIESVLRACAASIDGPLGGVQAPWLPVALDSVRILSACSRGMVAHARHAPDSRPDTLIKLDLDLCDEDGRIALQCRGMSWRPSLPALADTVTAVLGDDVSGGAQVSLPAGSAGASRTRVGRHQVSLAPVNSQRAAAESAVTPRRPDTARISLSSLKRPERRQDHAAPVAGGVRLSDDGRGRMRIDILPHHSQPSPPTLVAQLRQVLDRVRQEPTPSVLVLAGLEHAFGGGRKEHNDAVEHGLYHALASCPCPVVAVVSGDLIGTGFLAAAVCDFMVCSEDATYGFTDGARGVYPTPPEARLFGERFGEVLAQDFLYVSTVAAGRELRNKGWTCPIVAAADVETRVDELATALATKPQEAVRLLKRHLTRHLVGLASALTRVDAATLPTTSEDRLAMGPTPTSVTASAHLSLESPVDRVLTITLRLIGSPVQLGDLVTDLADVLARVHDDRSCRAIVLAIDSSGLDLDFTAVDAGTILDAQRIVMESPLPIIGAFEGNATILAWAIGVSCDACVYSTTGVYSSAGIERRPRIGTVLVPLFSYRLGHEAAREILLTGGEYRGGQLQQRVGAVLCVESGEVLAAAVNVATRWAQMPRGVLAAWKQQVASSLRERSRVLPARSCGNEPQTHDERESAEPESSLNGRLLAPVSIPLRSQVVSVTAHADGVVVVKLEDRDAKNMFSPAFMAGVTEAFEHIAGTPSYRVVVLTGYDAYFAAGGTKESLLAVHAGEAAFTDVTMFHAALDCPLPVIAAMQGHGVGAGWSLGMFADLLLFADESRYVSPYMEFGFTPGAGATWILADRMGHDFARESLLTARSYVGRDLRARGLTLRILPRADVYPAAMALARQIARAPREALMGLKQQMTAYAHEPLAETYRLELAMHERTFVGRPEIRARIQQAFGMDQVASPTPAIVTEAPNATPAAATASSERPEPAAVRADVTASLKTLLANEIQIGENEIDDDARFVDIGLDSIGGVSWIRRINQKYRISIEPTKVYAYPTLAEFSRYVQEEAVRHESLPAIPEPSSTPPPVVTTSLSPSSPEGGATGPQIVVMPSERSALPSRRHRSAARFVAPGPVSGPIPAPVQHQPEPIAVIGMAGQFPGARTLEQFWDNIAHARHCVTPITPDRWDIETHYHAGAVMAGKTNSRWVAALDDYDRFDPLFFNISPGEAENMDPQQRLFLQACWHSLEHAGYSAPAVSGSRCGVFAGCATGDYHQVSRRHQLSAHGFTGSAMSILAARISYHLDLQGPCVSIDTACSSSLVAIAQACESLTFGSSDLALAGGVYVMAGPEMHIRAAQAGMLSPRGACFTFDRRADGFVLGEAVGVIVLKRLKDAERDHDTIYGLIQGWGVNQDGKTNGITAPNPEAQTRLEQEVYDRFGIDPASIQLVEAHGTGTKLGDPIEVEGLRNAFRKYTQHAGFCALGSVKSNIGHCLTAAGVAGTIKVLLALQHRQLPPTSNFEQLNEHIDLADSPFYVNCRLQSWTLPPGASSRRAAISSFGFSGTNAHLVIGEYVPPPDAVADAQSSLAVLPVAVLLSARTPQQLQQKVVDLLEVLRTGPKVDLVAMAYTLQVGRTAMEERLGIVVDSIDQLGEKLQAYLADEPLLDGTHRGQARRNNGMVAVSAGETDPTLGTLSELVAWWVKGRDVDWRQRYGASTPRRIGLPLYPFARERYWIDAQSPQTSPSVSLQDSPRGGLLAVPTWHVGQVDVGAEPHGVAYGERHVILCELSSISPSDLTSALPNCSCLSFAFDDSKDLAQRYGDFAVACCERLQAILRNHPPNPLLVQIVVASDDEHAVFAGLSGLLKTAALEYPRLCGQIVLIPPHTATDALIACLQNETPYAAQDPIVRYERGTRQVLRWQELSAPTDARRVPTAFKDRGIYLITGGCGGLGTLFAKEIVGATRDATVILTGRGPLDLKRQTRLSEISERRHQVRYRQADLSSIDQVIQLIDAIVEEFGGINGILHSAGMLADDFIRNKTRAQLTDVLSPKVCGTYNLDQASQRVALDFFVLFSSIAAPLGNPGQADYAAANGFMDWFAAYRNQQVEAGRRSGRSIAINWGLWLNGGMRIDQASQELLLQTTGMQPMQTTPAMEAFHRSLTLPHDQVLAVEGLPSKIRTYLQRSRLLAAAAALDPAPRQFANKAEEFYADTTTRAAPTFKEEYLTFAPFTERRPGFSMSRMLLAPDAHPDEAAYVLARQVEMRQVLFGREDFGRLRSILDIGCGHGTDVIQIGTLFPHIQSHGCTITADQAALGQQRIASANLDPSRVQIHHQDSSRDPFPSRYDLVFGIEVSFHIRNKRGLFENICASLDENGRVLLADYVSNLPGPVDDTGLDISIPTMKEWASLTSGFQLEVDEIIDVSPEIANFLYDPSIEDQLPSLPLVSQRMLRSYANQSASLERGWLSYVLIALKRNRRRSPEEIERHNLERLAHPTPYAAALQATQRQPHVDYPQRRQASALGPPQPAEADDLQPQLTRMLAVALRMDASQIDVDKPFIELGLDSFLGVELATAINRYYGTELSNLTLFEHPTIAAFARFLAHELPMRRAVVPEPPAVATAVAPVFDAEQLAHRARTSAPTMRHREKPDDRIAIVGMSGRYPKAANLTEFWHNLVEGRNCISEVPHSRWNIAQYYEPDVVRAGKTNSKWLGALDDVECFDPLFFRISPHEAQSMDPQHRLFLQESYRAFEDAGYSMAKLSNTRCGVYLGISTNDYELLLDRARVRSASVTGNSHAIAAARIAYHLNLKGPAISVDTACSSSLVAIHLACQALRAGDADMAVAGGVTVWLVPEAYVAMSQAGMLSPAGQCRTFDDEADGIVVGDGVGAVVLKRLTEAEADGDHIHGVILGSGINQDGRTNGITAPSVTSQIALEREIYAKYEIDPESVGYVEAHGTGTRLGDPIELEALGTVFKEKTGRKQFCAVGAVKSNIGHTTAAAGVAGVHKVLLSMRHRMLVPTLNVIKPNSRFDFEQSPFYVSRHAEPWPTASGARRRAAISSFGFSGTNAHLVVEEYPPAPPVGSTGEPTACILPLSARTMAQLRQRARDLLAYVRQHAGSDAQGDLVAIAYTLQVGREPMEERLALLVRSLDELADVLTAWLDGERRPEHLFEGRVDRGHEQDSFAVLGRDEDMREAVDKWILRRKYARLAALWVRGVHVEWQRLYAQQPQRMSLPTYPFAKEHCWIAHDAVAADTRRQPAVVADLKSIEDVIDKLAGDQLETDEAVKLLRVLV